MALGGEESQPLKRLRKGVSPVSGNWASFDCVQLRPLPVDGRSGLLRTFPRLVTFPPGTVSHGSPRVVVAPEILGGFSSGQQLAWSVAGSWGTEGLQAVRHLLHTGFYFPLRLYVHCGGVGRDAKASPGDL